MAGELPVERPSLARGYLRAETRGSFAFIESPSLLKTLQDAPGRVYKTGDLVAEKSYGPLTFIGRNDLQVKLIGQRIELGVVEYYVLKCLPESTDIRVGFERVENDNKPSLVAFIRSNLASVTSGQFAASVSFVQSRLERLLPIYLIPTTFIPVGTIPLVSQGKTGRENLREVAARYELQEIFGRTGGREGIVHPATELHKLLRHVSTLTLDINVVEISIKDNFFWLGSADSFAAIKLAAHARSTGIRLSVRGIFKRPIQKENGRGG